MTFLMKELVATQIDSLKTKQLNNLRVLTEYVNDLSYDYFDPRTAPTTVVSELNRIAALAYAELELLQPWVMTDYGLEEFVLGVETEIDCIIDEFWSWSGRTIIDVKEAARLHERHPSTIYRWIKNGKLPAKKVNGRWQIIA